MSKIAIEVAQEEFVRLCEAWDVYADVDKMEKGEAQLFARDRDIITRAIEAGRLTVSEDGELAEYTEGWPRQGVAARALVFSIPRSGSRNDMDKAKPEEFHGRTHRYASAMCGLPVDLIASTDDRDGKNIRALASLALG